MMSVFHVSRTRNLPSVPSGADIFCPTPTCRCRVRLGESTVPKSERQQVAATVECAPAGLLGRHVGYGAYGTAWTGKVLLNRRSLAYRCFGLASQTFCGCAKQVENR